MSEEKIIVNLKRYDEGTAEEPTKDVYENPTHSATQEESSRDDQGQSIDDGEDQPLENKKQATEDDQNQSNNAVQDDTITGFNQNEAAASSTDESQVPSISRNNNNDDNNIDQSQVETEQDIPQNKNADEPMVEGNVNKGQKQQQQQPEVVWMAMPQMAMGMAIACPPGLEYFSMLDKLIVKQRIEVLEAITGYETENKYDVFNGWGERAYFAKEDSGFCQRQCCGAKRTFEIKFRDAYDREVIRFRRPFAQMCCNCCCLSVLTVEAPVGTAVGCVRQQPGNCKIRFNVECPIGNHVLTIDCPHACRCFCFESVPYPIFDQQGKQVGKISRKFTIKGMFTDADNFAIEFDQMLDVKLKACLMGGLFLIDFMFYESGGDDNRVGGGSFSMSF